MSFYLNKAPIALVSVIPTQNGANCPRARITAGQGVRLGLCTRRGDGSAGARICACVHTLYDTDPTGSGRESRPTCVPGSYVAGRGFRRGLSFFWVGSSKISPLSRSWAQTVISSGNRTSSDDTS